MSANQSLLVQAQREKAMNGDRPVTPLLNHSMLLALGPNVIGKVDEDILAEMEQDPRKVVETNWAVADEFEALMGDVEMRHINCSPEARSEAYEHMGTLLLAMTPAGRSVMSRSGSKSQ